MKPYLIAITFFLASAGAAQESTDGKYTVGILPATSTADNGWSYTSNLQSMISKVFVEKARFTVVDRSKFELLARERNLQKQEDFLNGFVVEQGKSLGAQFLISGNITQLTRSGRYVQRSRLLTKEVYTVYEMTIGLSVNLQIIDVATGTVKSNKLLNRSVMSETTDEQLAVTNAIANLDGHLKAWVNDVFPVYMRIIKVESVTKKGLPDKVLITGGSDMDLQRSGFIFDTSSELEVFENEVMIVDGKEYRRAVVIGKIKLLEVQGDLSVCKVKSGAEQIQKKLADGKTLLLRISAY